MLTDYLRGLSHLMGEGSCEEVAEVVAEVVVDLGLAMGLGRGIELAEYLKELIGLEVDALDGIVGPATFDGGPFDDGGGGGAERVAHVGLLENFLGARPCLSRGDELIGLEVGILNAV